MAEKKILLTEEGLKKFEEELENLKSVRRIEIAARLKEAIALGDLSENSEYEDAKNEQAFIEGRIAELEEQIRNSEIIASGGKGKGKGKVRLGNTVVIKDLEFDEDMEYTIVGSAEAAPAEFKISNESPVGEAIIDKKVGDIVEVNAPVGVLRYKILKIKG